MGFAPTENQRLCTANITDGTSNTILLGQGQIDPSTYGAVNTTPGFTDIIFNGGSPGLCRPKTICARDSLMPPSIAGSWGGPFSQGCLMAMCDGTVRMFPYSMSGGVIINGTNEDHVTLGAFLTPTGQETVVVGDT